MTRAFWLIGRTTGDVERLRRGIDARVLTGAFGKLPWKSRHILIQDEETYRALAVASREASPVSRPRRANAS